MSVRVLFAGGGTGGHVYPALAVAQALVRREPQAQVRFYGGRRGIEGRIVPEHGFRLVRLPAAGLRGRGFLGLVSFGWRFLVASLLSFASLLRWRPDVVLATGGYASAAPAAVAAMLGVPLWLQEQNSAPGSTQRVLARFAERAYVAFAPARRAFADVATIVELPNPVRASLVEQAAQPATDADFESLGLSPGRPTLLVFGGSGGAHTLNSAMQQASDRLLAETDWQVLLQTGQKDLESTRTAFSRDPDASLRVRVLSYIDDMAAAYRVADLVICRAGALTLAELATCGRASLLVPFPHATDDHQRHNAQVLAEAGASVWVDDAEFDGTRLMDEAKSLMDDAPRRQRMGAAARTWGGEVDAADTIARDLLARARHESAGADA